MTKKRRQKIIKGFKPPILCVFCGKEITELKGQGSKSLALHSLDGNHDNWDPANKVPVHIACHTGFHVYQRMEKRHPELFLKQIELEDDMLTRLHGHSVFYIRKWTPERRTF